MFNAPRNYFGVLMIHALGNSSALIGAMCVGVRLAKHQLPTNADLAFLAVGFAIMVYLAARHAEIAASSAVQVVDSVQSEEKGEYDEDLFAA